MASFLTLYLQILLFSVGPFLLPGLLVWLLRQIFVQLVGTRSGRPFLITLFALSTPLREAAHVLSAVLFFQRVEDVRFLDLRAHDGELGFTERSYNPKNPLAVLGNFLYALAPVMLGLVAVLCVLLLFFGGAMENFFLELSALGEEAGFTEHFRLAVRLLPSVFAASEVGLLSKIVGTALLLLLSMGLFISLSELLEGFFGMILYALLAALSAGALLLFDARIQRVVTGDLRAFATGVLALYLLVLAAVAALLAFGVIFFIVRKLGAVPEAGNALTLYAKKEE